VCLLKSRKKNDVQKDQIVWKSVVVFTHADGSRVSIAIIELSPLSVILYVCVCPHDKTKTAETKIAKLGQKVKGQGHSVTKCKSIAANC